MVIKQGDVYWTDFDDPRGSKAAYQHPSIVVQNNVFNASNIRTVIVCPLTSNLNHAKFPGNVMLEKKEANLPRASVALVAQIVAVNKSQLGDYIGTLASKRVREIIKGNSLVLEPRDLDKIA